MLKVLNDEGQSLKSNFLKSEEAIQYVIHREDLKTQLLTLLYQF